MSGFFLTLYLPTSKIYSTMKNGYVFPGQGAQFVGMGKNLYDQNSFAKRLFDQANEQLGFKIADVMFGGTEEELRQTNVTQPAIFLHSIIAFKTIEHVQVDMVAGHSLGEFTALVANNVLSFEDGLNLVSLRAKAMQAACEAVPGTMAAVLGLEDDRVAEICNQIDDVVVPANYNCPGQLVISGSVTGIEKACEALKAAGAKRALVLPVGGAFHSPLMEPAQNELAKAIAETRFNDPSFPVYQNVAAKGIVNKEEIQENLRLQLTGAVKWTQCVQAMIADGASKFVEVGPGKVLQGLILKINKEVEVSGVS
jgi:[acyl-carrier-protein] S-malonyltransferase